MTLNGPQGHVSAKTVASSVEMIEWGLQKLLTNVSEFDYKATNLLSCMTLDVENCHSTVHIKQSNISMLEYCRSFGLTMKESITGTTEWGGVLPYQQKVMVSQARGDNTVFQGTHHKAFARHSNVTNWL